MHCYFFLSNISSKKENRFCYQTTAHWLIRPEKKKKVNIIILTCSSHLEKEN